MISNKYGLSVWIALLVAVGGCTIELDEKIRERQRQLAGLSEQLEKDAPPIFITSHDLRADLRYRPMKEWLHYVTTPEFVTSMVGVDRSGEVVYKGGVGKAWLEPVHDTQANIRVRNLDFGGSASGLSFNAGVLADLTTTIRYEVAGHQDPLHCAAKMDPRVLNGEFKLSPINETKLPYRMEIRSPGETLVHVSCRIPLGLGTWRRDFVLGELVPNLSAGNLELGLSDAGEVTLPAEVGGAKLKYRIMLSNPVVETTAEAIVFQSDVDLDIGQ